MNFVDVIIIAFLLLSLVRGKEVGFVRQLCSTVGFFGGLLLGAAIEPHVLHLAHSQGNRTILTLGVTLGSAFIGLTLGEYVGIVLKNKVYARPLNKVDNVLGSGLAFVSILVGTWLSAAILLTLPNPGLQSAVRNSAIVSLLNHHLPPAPNIVADLGRLVDPNGFPQVFSGAEPTPNTNVNLPELGALQPAVKADAASVVKIEGQGCGGIVEGSGFVVNSNLIATNAHVVAGITKPYVFDANGTHEATVVYFDPNLDFAVLKVTHLAGKPLTVSTAHIDAGTPGAVLGYPGGGNFTAKSAAVLDQFTATGRNIYNQGRTTRDVYELKADIIPGNSGGPIVGVDGSVLGVVFAESTEYNQVGYALTANSVTSAISQSHSRTQAVSTGSCAE